MNKKAHDAHTYSYTYILPFITIRYLHARGWTRATKSHKIQVKQNGGNTYVLQVKDIISLWIMAMSSPKIQGRQIAKYNMDN